MNGAAGRFVYGFSSTDGPRTRAAEPVDQPPRVLLGQRADVAPQPAVRPKSRPWATRAPSTATSFAVKRPGSKVASMSQ